MTDATNESENPNPIVNRIMRDGPQASADLEQKRRIALRSFEITAKQLEADAGAMEQASILGEHDMRRRHELMRTAEALRVAQGWLESLCAPPPTQPEEKNESN